MLLFEVKQQMLTRLDVSEPATDSEQYLKAKFTINDADWNEKARTAYFRLGESVYKALLNSNNECIVPSEVLIRSESRYAKTHGSKIFVSLVGESGTVRITTNELQIDLNASGYADAETPKNPTENEYQQILTQYANNEAAINEAKAECETARADLVGVKNIFANAIKGNLSGAVVFADDVSPIEHNPVVWVHGKNLAKFNNSLNTDKSNFTYSQESASGIICTKNSTVGGNFFACYEVYLKAFTMYSISFAHNRSKLAMFVYTDKLWGNQCLSMDISNNAGQFYVKEEGYHIIGFYISGNISGDISLSNVQIEEGTTATEYEPYVEPTTMTIKRCGKNLLKNTLTTSSSSRGVNMSVGADGSIMFTGTSTEVHGIGINASIKLADGKYILTGGFSNLYLTFWGNSIETGEWVSIGTDRGEGVEIEASGKLYSHYLAQYQALSNVTYNAKSYPMIRHISSTDKTYESYIAPTEHTPSADGTVEGITTLSPNMTILTDTSGAIVECEYIKDTNKVLQKIADALNITI